MMAKTDLETEGLPYFRGDMDGALALAEGLFGKGGSIFTPNAEIAYHALHSRAFFSVLSSASLLLPDGVGVVMTERLLGRRLLRLPGVEFAEKFASRHRVYFVGGEKGVAEAAAKELKKKYDGLTVAGCRDGYFPLSDAERVIKEIAAASPELVLVGMGSPRQELFIRALCERMPTVVAVGVGGSLDIYAKKKKRAPRLMQKMGLEWLYRALCEPKRWKRIRVIPLFFLEQMCKNRKNAHLSPSKNALREKK